MQNVFRNIVAILNQILEEETFKNKFDLIFEIYSMFLPPLRIFLKEIHKTFQLEKYHIICAMIYIDLYSMKRIITSTNIHGILFTACMVSYKFWEEAQMDNSPFATVLGTDLETLNQMEMTFLEVIDYRLFTSELIYNAYLNLIDR